MAEERNLYKTVKIIMCARTLNYCEVKVPLIRPSTAGVPPRRGGGYYLFLPLVWPHGPIGHLGGPAPGVPRQWLILGAGPPRTA
jgi:hypothetical protein